jgi:hypothetical protein
LVTSLKILIFIQAAFYHNFCFWFDSYKTLIINNMNVENASISSVRHL